MSKKKTTNERPLNIDFYWVKNFGFTKTQAVVLNLLVYSGLAKGQHICIINNLFNGEALFVKLR